MQEVFTSEFWVMGGYAKYVWSAFGITLAVMVMLGVLSMNSHRKALRDVRRRREFE